MLDAGGAMTEDGWTLLGALNNADAGPTPAGAFHSESSQWRSGARSCKRSPRVHRPRGSLARNRCQAHGAVEGQYSVPSTMTLDGSTAICSVTGAPEERRDGDACPAVGIIAQSWCCQ